MARERRFEVEDTSTREAKHSSGGRQTFTIPPGLSFWKPKKSGSHNIDLVPYVVTEAINRFPEGNRFARPGRLYYERTYWCHSRIGVNEDAFTCPAKTFGTRCPVCDEKGRLRASPSKENDEKAKALQWSERQLFLVWDHDERDKGVQLWDVANYNFGKQLDQFIKGARPAKKEAYRRFFDPYDGFSLRITGEEKPMGGGGKNTIYSINEFFEREVEIPDQILTHGHDLDAMVKVLSFEGLRDVFRGTADPDEEGDDEGEDEGVSPRRPDREKEGRNGSGEPRTYRSSAENPPTTNKPDWAARDREEAARPAPKPTPAPARETAPPPKFASRDEVSFKEGGETVKGTVVKVDNDKRTLKVFVEEWDRTVILDFEDVILTKSDDTFDLKDAPKEKPAGKAPPASKGGGKWDDEEDDEEDDRVPKAKASKAPAEDDEAPTPRRKRS